jgi:capsular exopolysaccharide synthesis family protein
VVRGGASGKVPAQRRQGAASSPAVAGLESGGLTPAFVLWVLKKWWRIALPAGLVLGVSAAAVVMLLHRPLYESTALVMIESQAPYIAFTESKAGGPGRGDNFVATQVELMRSSIVLGPVLAVPEVARLEELGAAADRVKWLQSNLVIQQVGKSDLFDVTYRSPSARGAADVANSVVLEYLKSHEQLDEFRTKRVIEILDSEEQDRRKVVEQLRERVVELAKQTTGRDPFVSGLVLDHDRAMNPVASLHEKLAEIEVNREMVRARQQSLGDALDAVNARAESSGLLDLEIEKATPVRELLVSVDEKQRQVRSLEERLRDPRNDEDYQGLLAEIDADKAKLDELRKTIRDELLAEKDRQQSQRGAAERAALESELASLGVQQRLFSERLAKHLREQQEGGGKTAELEFVRSEMVREQNVLEMIAARKLALQTELRAPARVQLREKAAPAVEPLEAVPFAKLALACAAGLVAPFGLALAREATARRIHGVEPLIQESCLSVLGEIAQFPVRSLAGKTSDKLSNRTKRDMYLYVESIDSLRHNLTLSQGGSEAQVIAVTSANSGEGKTSVSTSLAMSFANATAEPVLIIDADMRAPDVPLVMNCKSGPGLMDVLSGACPLKDAIHPAVQSHVFVLPAGSGGSSPHRIAQVDRVRQLLEALRKEFPRIIIDTPPVLAASESLVFAREADAVLMCALRDVSRSRHVGTAVQRLEAAGAPLVGAVLNGADIDRKAYMYGYSPDLDQYLPEQV